MAVQSSTVCAWLLDAVELIHSIGWAGMIGVVVANPLAAAAIGGILVFGQSFFWSYLRSNC